MNSRNTSSPAKVLQLTTGAMALLALLLAYLYPLHLPPWKTFYNEWLFAVFVGLGLSWVMIAQRSLVLANPWPWALILMLVTLRTWGEGQPDPMQITLWGIFLAFGLVGWLAYSLGLGLRQTRWLPPVLAILWLAAMVSAIIAILQWSGVVSGANWDPGFIFYSEGGGRVSSNIGQANNLGTLLVLGIAAIGYAWYVDERRSMAWRSFAGLSLLVLAFGVYFSGSRTATVNLLLWPVLLFIWTRWRRHPCPWFAFAPIVLLGVIYLLMPVLSQWWNLFPAQEARSLVSDGNRMRLWAMVLTAIGERPWDGYGFGAVANTHLRLSPEFGAFDWRIPHQAHNTVLDMWANFGVPLGTLVVGCVLWSWGQVWLRSRDVAEQFIWLMTTAMIVHSMLEFPLHYGFFFWLLCLLLGVLSDREWKAWSFRCATPIAMVFLGIFMGWAVPVWQAYVQLESLYTKYRQHPPALTYQALQSLHPTLWRGVYQEPYERLRWLSIAAEEVETLSNDNLAELEKTALWYPLPNLGWRMALAHASRGDAEQSAWWAERMCHMFDPEMCAAAAADWNKRREQGAPWPSLPFDSWLSDQP